MDQPLRIFVVEDEVLLQMELETYLEDAGHEVAGVAASSREALSAGPAARPDLALVDIHLADGPTGVDVGRAFVEAGIPVVFLTANAARISEDFSGAIGVIGKPYRQQSLRDALDFLVRAVRRPPPPAPVPPALTLAPAFLDEWHLG